MSDSSTPATPPAGQPPAKRGSCLKLALIVLAVLVLLFGILWWWHNRPIKPVKLSADEKVVVEKKIALARVYELGEGETADPTYEKGKKEFDITERELNGLLNEHTKFGDTVEFELLDGTVHARVSTKLDPDFPIIGGKTLKARARFFAETNGGVPELVLDDLTVWGVSVPNDWLGGLKGKNLLGEVIGSGSGLSGVESLVVERGRLVVKLKD